MIGSAGIVQSVGSILAPLQLGFGVPSGCKAVGPPAHQYLASMRSNHFILKIDLQKCFQLFEKGQDPQSHSVFIYMWDLHPMAVHSQSSYPPPSPPSSRCQHVWNFAVVEASSEALVDTATDMETRARLLIVSCPESGAYLQALQLSSISLWIVDDVIRIAVSLHLGVAMCHPHVCACCGAQVNSVRIHGLSCCLSKVRHSRHATINDIF